MASMEYTLNKGEVLRCNDCGKDIKNGQTAYFETAEYAVQGEPLCSKCLKKYEADTKRFV